MASSTPSPLELERNELGYHLVEVREGRTLRVISNPVEGSDVCVFFVHGGGGRAAQFKHLIGRLKNVVNVVAFDFLGHGESPHIDQRDLYTADQHLQDLIAVYDKYKLRKNVYVSHSYGNIHVLRHLGILKAQENLDSLAGMMLIAVGVNAPVSLGYIIKKLPSFVLEWLRPFARSASNAAMFSPTTDPALIQFENSISDTNRMYAMRTIGINCSDQVAWDRWLEDGRQVVVANKVPRYLVACEHDGVFDLTSSKKLKELFEIPDDCYYIVRDVGHIPMLEKAEEVGGLLQDFLCQHLGVLESVDRTS